jgi:CubicO group peptidase (beta-lactamase class C family)
MFARSKKIKLLSLALFLSAAAAFAAPEADQKLVDQWSRMDELSAARGVRKADVPRILRTAPAGAEVEQLVQAFLEQNANTGLLVLRGDTILAERYQYGRTDGHRLASASMAKTVLAMLVGIALHEKKISSLDEKAEVYVPALKGHPYGATSIRHLLTMSSGMAFNEGDYSGNDEGGRLVSNTVRQQTQGGADTVLEFNRREAPAGTRFKYVSGDSQVLGLVLIAAVKQPLAEYLSEKIWRPMGAEANATWLIDKGGYETGFCCLNATLRDYGRFGLLLANYGALDGRQIIPEAWVRAATTAEAPHLRVGFATTNNGYGYQTWLTHRTEPRFAALGFRGQAIMIDPVTRLVVVHTAAWSDGRDRAARGAQFRLFETLHSKLASQ